MKIPTVSPELIEYLEATYRNECPRASWTDREIWIRAGQVEVVKHLRALHEDQVRRSLTSKN